ncbi:SPOR domain-containing protein [Frigidibacter sp. ROC022]|uniref:SPOR domain-containing protein n=1 Tax=Frigidibacter sp. ROC022 TaxID=2971796 RepID=UPI00215AD41D|nr:SPOR domain-containing protein [Frigidibacter sp. ROC022]MCR8725249.1 SPOR domain-containing protein [Frigidibacter sp. ROC022]
MADTELGELYGPATRSRGSVSGWIGLLGAATSLAMVLGVGVWGYKLLMRDVNGVPVVRALEGPMRIQPKDPGGDRMAFQGLAVNQVAAVGEAGEIADELVLAPPAPDLLDHDLPLAELAGAPVPDYSEQTDAAVAEVLEGGTDAEAADAGLIDPDAAPPVAASATLADAAPPAQALKLVPASVPGVKRSPRPPERPARLERAVAILAAAAVPEAEKEAAAAESAVEISADSLPADSRLVQLGAFDSVELARKEWGKIAVKFADVMDGKMRVIQKATSGGQTFYRLRVAGFEDLADARRFCAILAADKSKPLCVPVATR